MKICVLFNLIDAQIITLSAEYIAGIIIALFILGYLIYALIKPEKF